MKTIIIYNVYIKIYNCAIASGIFFFDPYSLLSIYISTKANLDCRLHYSDWTRGVPGTTNCRNSGKQRVYLRKQVFLLKE